MRYKKFVGSWFDYLIVSKEEIVKILENTAWEVKEFIDGEHDIYIAVIEKKERYLIFLHLQLYVSTT